MYLYIKNNMSRKELSNEDRKIKFSVTVNPILFNKIDKLQNNKSKYIEKLIYKDLLMNKQINEEFEL
jgi:hypothetical protein